MNPPLPTSVPEEHEEQVEFFDRVLRMLPVYPELGLLYAIPNGGKRGWKTAKKLKEEGVKPGVPDTCLPVARGPYHGLYIEMKKLPYRSEKTGKIVRPGPTDDQKFFIERLLCQGYRAVVRNGADDAFETLMEYMALGPFRCRPSRPHQR